MEFRVTKQKDREVTRCLFDRFLRTAGILDGQVQLIDADIDGTEFSGARLEMPHGPQADRIIALGHIDGLKVVPVPDQNT